MVHWFHPDIKLHKIRVVTGEGYSFTHLACFTNIALSINALDVKDMGSPYLSPQRV
jgi:hypothetical protein